MSRDDKTPASSLIGMVRGYQLAPALHAAAQLGIADHLQGGPRTVADLARATCTHLPSLARLLRALASRGVFLADDEGRYALSELGRALCSDAPGSVRAETPHVVPPDAVAAAAMAAGEQQEQVAAGHDFSRYRLVVDVGGGNGCLLAAILAANPKVNGILLDTPEVAADAAATFKAGSVADRAKIVAGDFFEGVPPGGDAYLLSCVLMDWGDDEAVRILRRCRCGMRPGGEVLIIERLIPADNRASLSQLSDLMGLVVTGGRLRSAAEFAELVSAASLTLRGTADIAAGYAILVGAAS